MHYIQRRILEKLLYAESLSYAAMRPSGIESNHYTYHLQQLLKSGLVVKKDRQYMLSSTGLATVDRMSHKGMIARLQPHIVTAIDVTNEFGETVLFRRKFQPYINKYGFPLGKTHYEEDIYTAAHRELFEKTGLSGFAIRQRGIVYLETRHDDDTTCKIICHMFQAAITGRAPLRPESGRRGQAVWLDHTTLDPKIVMPGFLAIKKLLENPDFFFSELSERA